MAKYIYTIGRRKTSVATLRLFEGKGDSLINEKPLEELYPDATDKRNILLPLSLTNNVDKFHFTVKTSGGGKRGQRDSIILALSRALVKYDADLKEILKKESLLTRDDRKKERKKTGLLKARKSPQFSKR